MHNYHLDNLWLCLKNRNAVPDDDEDASLWTKPIDLGDGYENSHIHRGFLIRGRLLVVTHWARSKYNADDLYASSLVEYRKWAALNLGLEYVRLNAPSKVNEITQNLAGERLQSAALSIVMGATQMAKNWLDNRGPLGNYEPGKGEDRLSVRSHQTFIPGSY